MYTYKLNHIEFNDGTAVEPRCLTVIVGPNNAGKSRALKDIVSKTTAGSQIPTIVVRNVGWTMPTSINELREGYDVERYLDKNGNWSTHILNPELVGEATQSIGGSTIWPDGYDVCLRPPNNAVQFFVSHFGKAMVAFLTTERRLQLVKESASPSHERQAASILQMLYNSGRSVESEIRQLVKQAFHREVALDFSTLQKLLLRVGDNLSNLPADPRDARQVLSQYEKLDEQGDGIRSFVGIIVAMLSVRRSLFLIDEPEAFLHPPQAFRIGEFLAMEAGDTRQIIMATHSADVLRGILSKTRDVNIIRIDRVGNGNRFSRLDPERLKELVNDPLLSSARVLDGLFYSGAVIVEADSDARFYQAASNKSGTDLDLHFVNADNKQTVPRIIKMYKDMGVQCSGIVDFDVLNDRAEFQRQLEALGLDLGATASAIAIQERIAKVAKELPIDERIENARIQLTNLLQAVNGVQSTQLPSHSQNSTAAERLLRQIDSAGRELSDSTKAWKQLKQRGRAALPNDAQSAFDELWDLCASHGLFINPAGELESMLVDYDIPTTTDKRAWITQALQVLPNLEVNEQKHPWSFIKAIHDHLNSISE